MLHVKGFGISTDFVGPIALPGAGLHFRQSENPIAACTRVYP